MEGVLGPGTTLNDRYQLTSRIGGGGMGEVWRATDTVLGREVAVKVLNPALTDNPTFAQRFQNEARAMATLRHPGVVDVYDYGVAHAAERAVSFLVMEYVRGESLDKALDRGPLTPEHTMRLVAEVADALSAAHAQGIVHRDVKPGNLLLRPDGRVALTDFGIAHSASAGQLTATGAMLCSAGYCAPEMATASDVTPSVDLYALGVVAYECLTGRLPFSGDTPVQIIYKHLHQAAPTLPGDVPPGPRAVVSRSLEKTPDRRWATAAEMAGAARRALADPGAVLEAAPRSVPVPEPVSAPIPEPVSGPVPSRGRRRALLGAVAVSAAVLATAAVVGSLWLRPATPQEQSNFFEPGTASVAPPTVREQVKGKQAVPPVKTSPTPKATPTASGQPTTPTPPAQPTPPSATPTVVPTPTEEPTPTAEPPTSPGPEEPSAEPSSTPGEIQCVREPCPS
ncbi:serine/threonine-protein kinase [Nonomuraea typhae]|uniref:serine/threonine-protein kinase n=1 Tax=Nonomuraea typhae TaxID=2603600 RepID=UPI001C681681|nr:serine/threonine-protein kinase [Nonomuraea typhae]